MHKIRVVAKAAALAIGVLMLSNCGGGSKRTADLLYDIRAYNEGIRWQKFPQSAVRILPAARDHFLDVREELEDELRVDDFEITRMKVTGSEKEKARVQVKWTWHMDSKGIVYTTTTSQKWKRFGKRWMLLQEFHVRGEEMPGVEEEPEEEDSDEKDSEDKESDSSLEASEADSAVSSALDIPNSIASQRLANQSYRQRVGEALLLGRIPPRI